MPFNCLIEHDTKVLITAEQNKTKESQGQIVDRAIALLLIGEEVAVVAPPPRAKEGKHINTVRVPLTPDEKLTHWRATRRPIARPKDR